MLTLTICEYCGDALHSFIEELEIGQKIHLVICPTCYKMFHVGFLGSRRSRVVDVLGASGRSHVVEACPRVQRVSESFWNSVTKPNEKEVIRNYEY